MSTSKTIELTFTQCKQLLGKGIDLRDFLEEIECQPDFIKSLGRIDSIAEIRAIQGGGCASGAYMPAVTYSTALKCMTEHYPEIENLLGKYDQDSFNFDINQESFASFASKLVSAAVECWVCGFDLDGVDWD